MKHPHCLPVQFARRLVRPLAALCLAAAASMSAIDVTTHRYDNARTSQNLSETELTQANVNATDFGLKFTCTVDEQIYGQPLYISSATMGGGPDLVFVTTVNNSVYAFNADTGAQVWFRNLGSAPTVAQLDLGGPCTDMSGKCGIVGTPVIDPATKKLYVVAKIITTLPNTKHTLFALDLATGSTLGSVDLAASSGGNTFQSRWQQNRPALLLANNTVYIAFASHCDRPYNSTYQAFILGYRKTDLVQVSIANLTPGTQGGIWQAGAGPAADASGNVYVMTGNGPNRNGTTIFNQSFVKLTPDGNGALSIANPTTDTFTPHDWADMNTDGGVHPIDSDLGSSGPLLIPGTNLITGGGKTGELWLLDRSNLGFLQANDAGAVQRFQAIQPNGSGTDHVHGGPIYWNSPTHGPLIYVWGESDFGRAYKLVSGAYQLPSFMATTMRSPSSGSGMGMPGNMLTVSSNGSVAGTGILWSNSNLAGNANNATVPGSLRAFNADNIAVQLWDSETTAGGANDSGNLAKYNYPTVADGKVYLATFGGSSSGTGALKVYGLLAGGGSPPATPTGLAATPGNAQVALTWTASAGATSYNIKRGTTSGTYTSTFTSATNSYTNTGLTNGTTYYYVVSAVNANGESSNSSQVSATPSAGGTPVIIEGESLTVAASSGDVWRTAADGNGSGGAIAFYDATAAADYVTLNVSIPAAATYNVKVRYKSGNNRGIFQLASAPAVGGTYTNIGSANDEYNASQLYNQLADCGNYTFGTAGAQVLRFTVTGKNAASSGFGLAIDSIELTPQGGGSPPATPTGLAATPGNAQVALTWTASAGATSYNIKRGTTSGTYTSTFTSATNSYTNTGLTNGTTYYYVVSAVNANGESGNSTQVSATPSAGGGGTTHQAESLTVAAISSGDTSGNVSEGGLSGGSGKQFSASAATDFITLTVPGVAAGTFNVFIGVKKSSTEGIFQLATASSTGGTYFDKGSPQDLYAASATYTEVAIGAVTFGSAGDKAFRFTVTGKNASSSDFDLVIDYIRIAP